MPAGEESEIAIYFDVTEVLKAIVGPYVDLTSPITAVEVDTNSAEQVGDALL